MKVEIFPVDKIDAENFIKLTAYANTPGADKSLTEHVRVSSHSWVGLADGDIACVWGLIPGSLISDRAYLWVLVTKKVEEAPFLFVMSSRAVMKEMMERHQVLYGMCEVEKPDSIRWLKLLGAKFGERKGNSLPFEIRRKECSSQQSPASPAA